MPQPKRAKPTAMLPAPVPAGTFYLVLANVAFTTENRRTQAKTFLNNYLAQRPSIGSSVVRDAVPNEKYGPGFGLSVTCRMMDPADAAQIWSDIESSSFNFITSGFIYQNIVTQLNEVIPVHYRSFPSQPTDF